MSDFVNTVAVLGSDVFIDQYLTGSLTEFMDDRVEYVGKYAFSWVTSLASVDMPMVKTLMEGAFFQATGLKTAKFKRCTLISTYAFAACKSLVAADFWEAVTIEAKASFTQCAALVALILRDNTQSTLKALAFSDTPIGSGSGYIYVPRALVDSYKIATNWSTYADQFRALEDYTIDGTTTGELDETKI